MSTFWCTVEDAGAEQRHSPTAHSDDGWSRCRNVFCHDSGSASSGLRTMPATRRKTAAIRRAIDQAADYRHSRRVIATIPMNDSQDVTAYQIKRLFKSGEFVSSGTGDARSFVSQVQTEHWPGVPPDVL